MNERIKELAVQAGDDWDHTMPEDKEFLERFAKLIVQECLDVLHDNELWSRHVSHALREHFGD